MTTRLARATPLRSTALAVAGIRVQPTDTRQDQVTDTLVAGRWRSQEGGG